MSKKPQPQKGENNKNKIETVDQQNQPFLRALQKKVRNINKKLADIVELQGKDNLKPEQLQKINRKDNLLQQRAKIQQNATFFKEVYAENAAHYRANQLKELEVLARALAIYHSGAKLPEQARLTALWRVLEQSDKTYPTLNTAITTLANALKDFANDKKLQKALNTHAEEHGNAEVKQVEINQEKIVNDILQQKPEKQEVKKEQPEPKVETQPEPQPVAETKPVVETKPAVQTKPVQAKTQVKAPEVPQVFVEQETTPIVQEPTESAAPETVGAQAEEKKGGDRRDNRNRDNRDRPYRGKGPYRGGRDGRDRPQGERRQYKPKYEEKGNEGGQQGRSSSSGSQSSEEVREFKKEEIKRLENDGFIVVGKPKPKAKNSHEVHAAHDRQHGKKFHHHGKANN